MSRMLKALKEIEAGKPERFAPASPVSVEDRVSSGDSRSEEATITSALARVEQAAAMAAAELPEQSEVVRSASRLVSWPSQPTEDHAQAYGKLADAILGRLTPGQPASLMFVSPTDRGGTTRMLVPLAAALAQRRPEGVVAVDANLRDPALARSLGVEATRGLDDVLSGAATWQETLRSTTVEGLSVLPGLRLAGLGCCAAERLNLGPLLRQLGEASSLVLIDAASLEHPEVAPMVAWCTGAYLVVRLSHTTAHAVDEAVGAIRDCGGRVLGSVLLGC